MIKITKYDIIILAVGILCIYFVKKLYYALKLILMFK